MRPKKLLYSSLEAERPKIFVGAQSDVMMRAWSEIVADYSETELTSPKDRLPALAGLTSKLSSWVNKGYSFGLWIDFMPQDLIWKARQPGRRMSDRAPSWSWASIEGTRVSNDYGLTYRDMTEHASMVRYPANTGPMGAFKAAIGLQNQVVGIETHTIPSTAIPPGATGKRWSLRLQGNDTRLRLLPDFDLRTLNQGLKLICALMRSGRRGVDNLDDLATVECLVLSRRAEGTLKDSYERVGHAMMHGQLADRIVSMFQQEEKKTLFIS